MAHLRKRYVEGLIHKAKSLSPIVGLLGHRQVGKTTVLERMCGAYTTFDQAKILALAKADPERLLVEHSKKFQGIDECQLVPDIFPALKEHVRKDKKPGQFLLSGSVRFTSRAAIRESLTGRIVNFELLPLTISEIAHQEIPQTLELFWKAPNVERIAQSLESQTKRAAVLKKELAYYYTNGGLPGVCFIRNESLRNLRIKEQLQTILDRDIRLVYPTTLGYQQILEFLTFIAKTQGQSYSYASAQKHCSIGPQTQKKLLYALEAVFMIRRLPILGSVKGQIFYLEDQAESVFLSGRGAKTLDDFEQLIYRNLRAQFYYKLGASFREFHFQTRGGSRLSYCIEQSNSYLGIIPIEGEVPTRADRASAASFLRMFGQSRVLFVHEGESISTIDSRSLSAPVRFFV